MNFIKEKDPYSKEYIAYANIHTENYNVNKENESFISGLKESDVSYITNNKIIKKHWYRDGLHLNRKRKDSKTLIENCLSSEFFIGRDWHLNNQTRNQSIAIEEHNQLPGGVPQKSCA